MDAAYRAFLIDNAEVCVQQMVLRSTEAHQAALERLEAGEEFDKVARELSEDSFVDREAGESGAGGAARFPAVTQRCSCDGCLRPDNTAAR